MNKKQRTLLFVTVSILITFLIWLIISSKKTRPTGEKGHRAEELFEAILQKTAADKLKQTAAVSFRFVETNTMHIRDQKRGLVKVEWNEEPIGQQKEKIEVFYSMKQKDYMVRINNKTIDFPGQKKEQKARLYFEKAVSYHRDHFFWFHPFYQMQQANAKRSIDSDGALIVSFTSGDTYQIFTDPDGLPVRWKLWVEAIPAAGIEMTFSDWKKTKTGFLVSQKHDSFNRSIQIDQIQAYEVFPRGVDPFQEFVGYLTGMDEKES